MKPEPQSFANSCGRLWPKMYSIIHVQTQLSFNYLDMSIGLGMSKFFLIPNGLITPFLLVPTYLVELNLICHDTTNTDIQGYPPIGYKQIPQFGNFYTLLACQGLICQYERYLFRGLSSSKKSSCCKGKLWQQNGVIRDRLYYFCYVLYSLPHYTFCQQVGRYVLGLGPNCMKKSRTYQRLVVGTVPLHYCNAYIFY